MSNSERINKEIQEAVAAVRKARAGNTDLNTGLGQTGNLIKVKIDMQGEGISIEVPVNVGE